MLINKKQRKMGKKALCIIFALIFCINSMAAIVSDNDGSVFITKAEFEALKKDFADQIENYNNSIDSKIDGAIANYLSGIRLNRREKITNKYDDYEFASGQKFNLLKWTNSTNYNLNKCDRESNKKDYQDIWTTYDFYIYGKNKDATAGKAGIIKMGDYSETTTTENRLELDKFGRITAWGPYNHGFHGLSSQTATHNNTFNTIYTWMPLGTGVFAGVARRPWRWTRDNHTATTEYTEINFAKAFETMPAQSSTFDMAKVQIAPLSTTYEGRIGPQPDVSDTSNFTVVTGTSTSYGAKVLYYKERIYLDTSARRTQMNVTLPGTNDWTTITMADVNNYIYRGWEARWFDCAPYNDGKFACIYTTYGIDCPMKSGIPLTTKNTISSEDKVIVQVDNPQSNGYLIPYLAKSPSETWGGAKTNYTVSKYSIQKNKTKEIELTVDSKDEYYLFVVWLPTTACVLPNITIHHEISL